MKKKRKKPAFVLTEAWRDPLRAINSDSFRSGTTEGFQIGEQRKQALVESTSKDLKAAKELFEVAKEFGFPEFEKLIEQNPPSARCIYFLVHFAQGNAEEILQSENASIRASAPRKKEDQETALNLWKEWQDKPYAYPNKQQFIADVTLKCEVSPKTARTWFDKFRADSSSEWEAMFGKKYPI